jgi:hypothetical protein
MGEMDESIREQLARAAVTGSRQLDRMCELIAQDLLERGEEPTFQIQSANFAGDGELITADRYWRLRFLQLPTVSTAADCARWLHAHVDPDVRTEVEQKWALGYAFITKGDIESGAEVEHTTGKIMDSDQGSSDIAYFATLYHAGKFRANFNFDELGDFLKSSLLATAAGPRREDPLFKALEAFAAFGQYSITSEFAVSRFTEAWSSPRRTRATIDVCLSGLWVGRPFDDQGELLRTHAEEAATSTRATTSSTTASPPVSGCACATTTRCATSMPR